MAEEIGRLSNAELKQLTQAAEAGKGCEVMASLGKMSFEQSLLTMRKIAQQSMEDRHADPSLPLVAISGHEGSHPGGELYLSRGFLKYSTLMTDTISVVHYDFGKREQTCTDLELPSK